MEHLENEGEKVKFFGSPKLSALIALLEKIGGEVEDPANKLKVLVFVQRRYTSKCLYHILRRYSEAKPDCHLRPDFIVGTNNQLPESIEAILQSKNNKKTLDKFKKNETNLICASSVLEEGIDLQMCNVVIAYDAPKTFTSYAQTKGRARMRESQYVVMIDAGDSTKMLTKIAGYQKVEQKLREVGIRFWF
jgi:endoribonuclease Dicer